ncbi:DUF4097 family beta strand repeat-containing protein [Spongiactinospora sp. TRM90649]|uniref:DUF4097 family beta strand repeat-containing protein n=1 Tax=Spongiactinospora sp. TRM90649 TaxID=3031114 RepID=UPI0023F78F19|nr:DUF4097 family beta strand repeat-containing protein [Spongiactinospora sp. TRM90649]MDF5755846.1 DUF4097 family beta strand repeat-containing protein [Spongiactinospora sp. TRM90649]
MRRILVLAGALAAATTLASCGVDVTFDSKERHDVRDFPLPAGALTIKSGVKVHVVAGNGPTLKVERWVRGKAANDGNATWSMRGDTLTLTANCQMIIGDCGGRYLVRVPGTRKLTVNVPDDNVRLTGMPGDVEVTTRTGDVRVENALGAVRLNTGDGRLTVTGARSGVVRARSGSGDIDLSFATAPAEVRAMSTDGRVTATLPEVEGSYRVTASSREGSKRSTVRHAPKSERIVVVRSVSEDVRLRTTRAS